MPTSTASPAPCAWILAAPDAAKLRFWGLTPEERLRRALRNAGCTQVGRIEAGERAPKADAALLLRGDLLFDPRLVEGLLSAPGVALWASTDGPGSEVVPVAAHVDAARFEAALALLREPSARAPMPAGLRRVSPEALAPAYIAALRKAEPPTVWRARPERVAALEQQLFGAAYKTITDLVTRFAWPAPAAALTRVLARRRVHPNSVTVASWILAAAALVWFAQGRFGLGLVAAWGMTFLDTVDGKLARVTLTTSRFGHVMDHGLDLVHPPFWYLAWGYGAAGSFDAATSIVVAGYFAGRLLEGLFLLVFSMETHCWRPIDNLFRTITARRNPNLILLSVGAAAGAPERGMQMVAIWTTVSLAFHGIRLLQALRARRRGAAITPWDEAAPRGPRPTPRTATPAEGAP